MRLERSDLELEVLVRRIEGDEVDLQPDFQRGEIWNDERRRRLIDNVLRGWYDPSVNIINDPETSRDLVLDGQQRLAAIRLFFRDELRVDGYLSPPDPALQALDGMVYSELPEDAQRRVRRFPLTVVTLTNYEPEEPYELFFRLNQHMALTPPEKRNALYGEARDQVKDVVGRLTEQQLLTKDVVGFANSRLAYDDVFARVALALQTETLREPFSNRAIEDFYREHAFSQRVIGEMVTAAQTFLAAARDVRPKLNKATLFSWLVFTYALNRVGDTLETQFLGEFEQLRRAAKSSPRELPSPLHPIVRTYNDRASYRVNDTLSVLLRDLSLHAARLILDGRGDPRGLGALVQRLDSAPADDGEQEITRFLAATEWDLP
ncbi:MAG TPA: DUF262 domain-containing protein, partial [Solirubrobacteraceae bacterium]|nr:DUF262 domain-containing protein [Solirubrobacteraceae bacterium]